jgi:two-component system chemotaxis response regulator CheY
VDGPRPDILIVEDDDETRTDLAELLGSEGYEVVTATNGDEALKLLDASEPPKLILLDLLMPVMNGWDFRTRQLAKPSLAAIPVVILSGAANVLRSAVSLSAAGYLTKPLRLTQLLETIQRVRAAPEGELQA